jgi:hypothetical protein
MAHTTNTRNSPSKRIMVTAKASTNSQKEGRRAWDGIGHDASARGIPDPDQPSAMGPIIRGYIHRGELILLDRVPSMRARRHNGTMGIYKVVR